MLQWSDIALRHSVGVLRDALWVHMNQSRFLPTMADVNACVEVVLEQRKVAHEAKVARSRMNDVAEWKAQWEREREEDRQTKLRESAKAVQVSTEVE